MASLTGKRERECKGNTREKQRTDYNKICVLERQSKINIKIQLILSLSKKK